ncbi:MAG: hypothetical protein A3J27_11735 [Candidatus Tectomicrobia bacterium RIFCSPLOWO2_12_FULL_69_37]|nr:MAG: hypothetical protein A3J27_11735 [Candidatus Tectomicrobia bacterium RIFCSPLOWO2_12_FULL_69_37]OGL59100.1 MAG: hypothetical protein A3I72_06655 [Candidatus Tectomicrobia bacterium RIFCSPLOWO2_02_FULL_70_19]
MRMARLSFLAALAAAALAAAPATAAERYRFGSGPAGGAWNPAIGAGTQLLNQKLSGKYHFLHSPSAGSVANVRRVALGEFETTWAHVVQVYQQWFGTQAFTKDGVKRTFRVVANVRQQTQIIAVLADSPIKSYADMAGKKVNLLSRGSGSSVNCVNIFTALGLIDKVDARYLGFAESGRALGDRQVDVFCSAGAPFTIPALTELSMQKPVRYVSMTEAEQKKVVGKFQFYASGTIPVQKDVRGMKEPARTIQYDVFWLAHQKMSNDAVYDMLKVVAAPENLEQLSKAAGYWKTLSGNFASLKEHKIFVHPAAARYWKEQGASVPEDLVKGF